jgi:hypothetical protein
MVFQPLCVYRFGTEKIKDEILNWEKTRKRAECGVVVGDEAEETKVVHKTPVSVANVCDIRTSLKSKLCA